MPTARLINARLTDVCSQLPPALIPTIRRIWCDSKIYSCAALTIDHRPVHSLDTDRQNGIARFRAPHVSDTTSQPRARKPDHGHLQAMCWDWNVNHLP